jgi:hypothetical protein
MRQSSDRWNFHNGDIPHEKCRNEGGVRLIERIIHGPQTHDDAHGGASNKGLCGPKGLPSGGSEFRVGVNDLNDLRT